MESEEEFEAARKQKETDTTSNHEKTRQGESTGCQNKSAEIFNERSQDSRRKRHLQQNSSGKTKKYCSETENMQTKLQDNQSTTEDTDKNAESPFAPCGPFMNASAFPKPSTSSIDPDLAETTDDDTAVTTPQQAYGVQVQYDSSKKGANVILPKAKYVCFGDHPTLQVNAEGASVIIINSKKSIPPEVDDAVLKEGVSTFLGISVESVEVCDRFSDFKFTFVIGKNLGSQESSLDLAYKVKDGLSDGLLGFLDGSRNPLNLQIKSVEISVLQGSEKGSPLPGDSRVRIKANCSQEIVPSTKLQEQWAKTIADYLNADAAAIKDLEIGLGSLFITFLIKDEKTSSDTALDLAFKVKDGLSDGSLVFVDDQNTPFDIQLVTIAISWIPNGDYEQKTQTGSHLEATVGDQEKAIHQTMSQISEAELAICSETEDSQQTKPKDSGALHFATEERTANIKKAVCKERKTIHHVIGDESGTIQPILDAERFITAIKNTNILELQESERLYKNNKVTMLINPMLFVAAFGTPEVVAIVHKWEGLNIDEDCDIPLLLRDFFEGMPLTGVSPLSLATFLNKKETTELIAKYSREKNISTCLEKTEISDKMTDVLIKELIERLKKQLSGLILACSNTR